MIRIIDRLSTFLVGSKSWMNMTLILFISYAYMQMSQSLSARNFLLWISGFVLFSLPVLIYQEISRHNWSQVQKRLVQVGVFIIYPLLLYLLNIDLDDLAYLSDIFNLDMTGEHAYSILSILFIILEITQSNFARKVSLPKWRAQFSTTGKVIMLMVLLEVFSILLVAMSNYFELLVENKSRTHQLIMFQYYSFQVFIIYGSYYLYYYIHKNILFSVLKQKGVLAYLLGILCLLLTVVPIHNVFISLFPVVSDLKLHTLGMVPEIFDDFNYSLPIITLIISFPFIALTEWYKQSNTLVELEKQRAKNELEILKHQLNPHFFFNTLNNLYAMSLTHEKETPETILQLSELMRYVIYKGKEDSVLLHEEIKYIQDYVDLQLIRIQKSISYNFDIQTENDTVQLPPLLFIILVENAFKHGIEPSAGSAKLELRLNQHNDMLEFECYNSKDTSTSSTAMEGIGLENLRQRLEILYPQNHELKIENGINDYKATLKIKL